MKDMKEMTSKDLAQLAIAEYDGLSLQDFIAKQLNGFGDLTVPQIEAGTGQKVVYL